MKLFVIQIREGKRWRPIRFGSTHGTIEAAVKAARALDEDGLLLPSVRIVCDGKECPSWYRQLT